MFPLGQARIVPPPAPPFWVEYYCPRQSPNWQRSTVPQSNLTVAARKAQAIRPPRGAARVIDGYGREVFTA